MDEFKQVGELLAKVNKFRTISSIMVIFLTITLIILVAAYIIIRKKTKVTEAADKRDIAKKLLPLRLTIIVVSGALAFFLIPIVVTMKE